MQSTKSAPEKAMVKKQKQKKTMEVTRSLWFGQRCWQKRR